MNAFVEQKFTKGYILNEEKIRKIHEIISGRLTPEGSVQKLKYIVLILLQLILKTLKIY